MFKASIVIASPYRFVKRNPANKLKIKSFMWFFVLMVVCLALLTSTTCPAEAAYLRNIPQTLTQPDGSVVQCLASGDEYYNWLHDSDGYVIIQNHQTGYYVYAVRIEGEIVPSKYVVGIVDPNSVKLEKGLKPSQDVLARKIHATYNLLNSPESKQGAITSIGTINNIVVFIRFSDEPEFTDTTSTYDTQFNSTSPGISSMRSYFNEASYAQTSINSTFYPVPGGSTVVSYQDSNPRSYYKPYDAATNPNGYQGGDSGTQRTNREHTLLKNAINAITSQVPPGLVVDSDNDGNVDNVCFIIKGSPMGWASLLWPHMWSLYSQTAYINGKRVYYYNFQLQSVLGVGVLCHEMSHTLGAPDLYHYTSNGINPVYTWDIMEYDQNPPQHPSAYTKFRYLNWISSIPEITAGGTYTLNPITSPSGNAYKIRSPQSTSEYYIVEYRRRTGTFESSIPGSGLLVYRINTARDGQGNSGGPPDEIYVYRPNGTLTVNGSPASAHFSANVGRTAINDSTNPSGFLSNGALGGLTISNIGTAGSTISFNLNLACTSPTIDTAPLSQTKIVGQSVTFCVAASGSAPLGYQWRKNGSNISGANSSCYTIQSVNSSDAGSYSCVVTNSCGTITSSAATLTIPLDCGTFTIGTGTDSWDYPMHAFYHDARTQTIYLASEIGRAGYITAIALDVVTIPGQVLNSWTIRMKHTNLSSYSSLSWETGWTTVYQSNEAISGTGWRTFAFTTPFSYDGVNNLMIDFSFNNSSYTTNGLCRYSVPGATRSIYYYTDSVFGDPLTWSGTTSPTPYASNKVTNVRLTMSSSLGAPTDVSASLNNICAGGSTTLSATPGVGGDTVAWYSDSCSGTLVGTGSPLTVSPTSTTTYYAKTRNSVTGCMISNCAPGVTVTVSPIPGTPTAPSALPSKICVGGSSTLADTPGSGGDTVVWYTGSCGGTFVGTGTHLSVSPTTTTTYYPRTKNSTTGCLSLNCAVGVTVTVNPLPGIPTSPTASPAEVCAGSPSILSAYPGSDGNQVWWFTNGCGGQQVGAIPGDQTVNPTTTTTYYARTKNSTSGCWSPTCASVTVTVNCLPPVVSSQPASHVCCTGEPAEFCVTAAPACGSLPITYQWRRNNIDIPDATNACFNVESCTPSDSGSYTCVVGTSCGSTVSAEAELAVGPCATISEGKRMPDNMEIAFKTKPVVAEWPDAFYIEEPLRNCGIRVQKSAHGLFTGQSADVKGMLKTTADGERYVDAALALPVGTSSIRPLLMNNENVGGGDYFYNSTTGAGQRGIKDASELNTIGLLVRTWGTVSKIGSDYLYLDDGASLMDGTFTGLDANIGIRVLCDPSGRVVGDPVIVTGVCSCQTVGAGLQRLIRTRTPADILPMR